MHCQYCTKEFENSNKLKNHECRCPSNPNKTYENGMLGKTSWNKGLTKSTDERIEKASIKLKETLKTKPLTGVAIWSKEQRSIIAKSQGFGGYRENAGRSKKYKVKDSFNNDVTLQSSYEYKCMLLLNEMNINWIRPKHIKYDNGRKYFPDFLLVDFQIYLDTKNPYIAKLDKEKIQKVIEQNNVKLYVLLKENITKEYITGII